MKKLLCLVCCAVFLAGCTMIKENNEPLPAQVSATGVQQTPGAEKGGDKALLYFLSGSEDKLVSELRSIQFEPGKNPAETVTEELIKGPQQGNLEKVADVGITLDHVELTDGLAMVYVNTQGSLPDEKARLVFETAAADTLIDSLHVSFVSVFWNGVSPGLFNRPEGPLSKYTGSLSEAYAKAESQVSAQPSGNTGESRVVLYFKAQDGSYILPEVRNVTFPAGDYVKAIVQELIKGPKLPGKGTGLIDGDAVLQNVQWNYQGGQNTLGLYFSGLSKPSEFGDMESEALKYASIVYTLTGFLADVDNIRIFSDGEEVKELSGFKAFPSGMLRTDFAALLGKSIEIYLMYKDSSLLTGVSRTVSQSDQWDAMKRLKEFFKGPGDRDADYAWPLIPAGAEEGDILGVTPGGDTVTLNLSQSFKDHCKDLTEEGETLLVYGIVNTLTEINGIRKVKFLVEGKETPELAGHLYMKSFFLRNPGIIKNN